MTAFDFTITTATAKVELAYILEDKVRFPPKHALITVDGFEAQPIEYLHYDPAIDAVQVRLVEKFWLGGEEALIKCLGEAIYGEWDVDTDNAYLNSRLKKFR